MVTSKFFIVFNRVTNKLLSVTSPMVFPISTRSPTLKGRIYVITMPATMFDMAAVEPKENNTPKNIDTPLKPSD